MGVNIQPNVVVCPHCNKDFQHNRVNGLALLEIASSIQAKKQMHCRLTLNALERQFPEGLPREVKKAILDGYNDLARDMNTILGFEVE